MKTTRFKRRPGPLLVALLLLCALPQCGRYGSPQRHPPPSAAAREGSAANSPTRDTRLEPGEDDAEDHGAGDAGGSEAP